MQGQVTAFADQFCKIDDITLPNIFIPDIIYIHLADKMVYMLTRQGLSRMNLMA